jgi:hypothetical protein
MIEDRWGFKGLRAGKATFLGTEAKRSRVSRDLTPKKRTPRQKC